ncbi:hypothetical protein BDZ97DRAFT_1822983 [Flammula alnicola]|nr:hypothetical protein BDZ97DRAFT_1822935 [Flammula alnicola]KAF8962823.1 hypothetical protein BDZ97DRAFT_1822983 [Flammula alnicola]
MIQSQVYPTHKPPRVPLLDMPRCSSIPTQSTPVSSLAAFTVDSTPTPPMPRKKTHIHQ